MIEFTNVGLRYGHGPEILRDLSSASIRARSISHRTFGIGKTSLLRLLLLSLSRAAGTSRCRAATSAGSTGCPARDCAGTSALFSANSDCSTI